MVYLGLVLAFTDLLWKKKRIKKTEFLSETPFLLRIHNLVIRKSHACGVLQRFAY